MMLPLLFLLTQAVLNPCAEFGISNGPQVREGLPQAGWTTLQLDAWWTSMQACRTYQLDNVDGHKYKGTAFKNPDLDWTQRAFAIPMVQGYDRMLYDEVAGKYTVDRYVDDLIAVRDVTRCEGERAAIPHYASIGHNIPHIVPT